MGEPILELRHVRKRFGSAVPADDMSLAIETGESFTFLGRAVPASRRSCGSSPASIGPTPVRSCCGGATSAMCRPGSAISAWSFSNTPISCT
jgi:hypothetical protein